MRSSPNVCPQDHGALLFMSSGHLYCPHVRHDGNPFYTTDLSPAPRSAPNDRAARLGTRVSSTDASAQSGVPGSPLPSVPPPAAPPLTARASAMPAQPPAVAPLRRPGAPEPELSLGL